MPAKKISTPVRWKKTLLLPFGLVSALIGSAIISQTVLQKTVYTVSRVIDGDTFETSQKQIIRINGIQAPEKERCGWEEATHTLSTLILNKPVYIKVVYLDTYRRMIADVYLHDGSNLAEKLAHAGTSFVLQKSGSNPVLLQEGQQARAEKRGIYGYPCSMTINTDNPKCNIKANIAKNGSPGIYHFPGCRKYETIIVQKYIGDAWFCSEYDAQKAGYTRAKDCPENK